MLAPLANEDWVSKTTEKQNHYQENRYKNDYKTTFSKSVGWYTQYTCIKNVCTQRIDAHKSDGIIIRMNHKSTGIIMLIYSSWEYVAWGQLININRCDWLHIAHLQETQVYSPPKQAFYLGGGRDASRNKREGITPQIKVSCWCKTSYLTDQPYRPLPWKLCSSCFKCFNPFSSPCTPLPPPTHKFLHHHQKPHTLHTPRKGAPLF